MSPNRRKSLLRSTKKIPISYRAKLGLKPRTARKAPPEPDQKSEVKAPKELRVILTRSISMNTASRPSPAPLTNGVTEASTIEDPEKDRRLYVKLQNCFGKSGRDDATTTPSGEQGERHEALETSDFNIDGVFKKYADIDLKLNGPMVPDVEVDEVLTVSSSDNDEHSDDSPMSVHDFFDDEAVEGEPLSDEGSSDHNYSEPVSVSESDSEPDDYDLSDRFICDDSDEDEVEEEIDECEDKIDDCEEEIDDCGEDTNDPPRIIIHENIEIEDKELRSSIREVFDTFRLATLRRGMEGGADEINHWEVDGAGTIWNVEVVDSKPSDK